MKSLLALVLWWTAMIIIVICMACQRDTDDLLVGEARVRRLSDQRQLADIAIGHDDFAVRRAAAVRLAELCDPSGASDPILVDVAIRSTDVFAAQPLIGKIANERSLAKVALKAQDEFVAKAAIESNRLSDESLLTIAASGKHPLASIEAIMRLRVQNQEVLQKIVDGTGPGLVRSIALSRLRDERQLRRIATTEREIDVRMAAIGGIACSAGIGSRLRPSARTVRTPACVLWRNVLWGQWGLTNGEVVNTGDSRSWHLGPSSFGQAFDTANTKACISDPQTVVCIGRIERNEIYTKEAGGTRSLKMIGAEVRIVEWPAHRLIERREIFPAPAASLSWSSSGPTRDQNGRVVNEAGEGREETNDLLRALMSSGWQHTH